MKRFTVVDNGYDVNEVNRFIDIVIRRLEKLNNENNEYYQKITELTKKIEELNNKPQQTETTNPNIDSLNKAILAVQETADRMKSVAKEESRMIIEDAKRNANSIVHEALVKAEKTEIETAMLKKNINIYKNRMKNMLTSQLEMIDDMDKDEIE